MSLLRRNNGIHFQDPRFFQPFTTVNDNGLTIATGATPTFNSVGTTAFFTEIAKRGLQDQTNWVANTYKTLLSISSGMGVVAAVVGPAAGGAETTTFEFTVDGVVSTITITNANTERAVLANGLPSIQWAAQIYSNDRSIDAGITTFQTYTTYQRVLPGWDHIAQFGMPCLVFYSSLLIRAKHSAIVTNATTTAYSGIMYRNGINS